jgi:hypothetical protein
MNVFDQSARFVAKSDPAGFLRWLIPGLPSALAFQGWLDTRTLPFPGEADRTCDTVVELFDPSDPSTRWAVATEFQSEPDADILDRNLEYLARLRRELRHGPRRRDKFRVAAALVHLTGPRSADTLDMTLPCATPVGLRLTIASRALRDDDAASTLTDIEAGRTSRCLLPWIPLMKGGGKPTMVEDWKRLALTEPDFRSRTNHAALALIFAGLTRHLDRWKKALEGWNVKESTVVNEWKAEWKAEGKAEGAIEARRDDILRLLKLKFPGQVPAEWVAAVEAQADLKILSRWLEAVAIATSPAKFQARSGIGRGK